MTIEEYKDGSMALKNAVGETVMFIDFDAYAKCVGSERVAILVQIERLLNDMINKSWGGNPGINSDMNPN